MSRVSPWRRAFTALIGCWYTLASVEPVPLHPCAMHEGAAVAVAQATVQQTVQSAVRALLGGAPTEHAAVATAVPQDHGTHAHHAPLSHHGRDAAAGAAPAHGTPADAASAGGEHDHAAGCLCIGGCSGAPPAIAAPTAPLAWLATILPLAPALDAPGALERPSARVDVALPFPVGPPRTA